MTTTTMSYNGGRTKTTLVRFTIHAVDRKGRRRCSGGDSWQGYLHSKAAKVTGSVKDHGDGNVPPLHPL
eukprot:1002414-Prorocentrum_minimum.AAC.1